MTITKAIFSISFFSFLIFSCSNDKKEYFMASMIKGIEVGKEYSFCDSSEIENCYLVYAGNRYLKKEELFFNSEGSIDSVHVFKPEGIVNYSLNELTNDSLLVKANGWGIRNLLQLNADSIVFPFKAELLELNTVKKRIYSLSRSGGHEFLYLIDYQ